MGVPSDVFGGLPPLPLTIWTVNVTTYVTTVLASVDDFFPWCTQFTGFVIMHQLLGMLDGSSSPPPSHVITAHDISQPNPSYAYWLEVDQLVCLAVCNNI